MIKINNIHQPYLFVRNGETMIIASEFQNEKLPITFGNDHIFENYWKIKLLDSDFNIENVITPESIQFNNKTYFSIQECNPFVYGNKISYVIGGHTKENNSPMLFFLVQGDFDFETKVVSNVQVINRGRTGFVVNGNIFTTYSVENQLLLNGDFAFGMNSYLDYIIRIIGVFEEKNKIIVTGKKDNNYQSFLIDLENQSIDKIKNIDGNDIIYKCSLIGDEENGLLAYTNKVFEDTTKSDYVLNIQVGYKIEKK
jgi:hypothetical protein